MVLRKPGHSNVIVILIFRFLTLVLSNLKTGHGNTMDNSNRVYRISNPYICTEISQIPIQKPWETHSLISTIDGSTLPQDCLEEEQC